MAFKSKDLVFSIGLDDDSPDEEGPIVLRLKAKGCKESVKATLSCGRTQLLKDIKATKVPCEAGPEGFKVTGVEGLRSLKAALREMLNQLEPVEKEVQALEEAEAQKKEKKSSVGKEEKPAPKKKPSAKKKPAPK
jgi:hypothetical protein